MKRSELPAEKSKSRRVLLNTLKEYGTLALVLFIITSSFIQGSRIPTPSMEKTIMTGDFLLTNKLAYGLTTPRNIPFTDIELPFLRLLSWGEPRRGDVVVFEFPGNRDEIKNPAVENYVKRCVAVPGDTLYLKNKILYVNGKEAPIPIHIQYSRNFTMPGNYSEEVFPEGENWNGDNYGPVTVPGKGDIINLSESNIDRWETFINREYGRDAVNILDGRIIIDGKETAQYKVRDDYYFMLGDNRDNSLDSRYWGFVPKRNVVGRPLFVYWSWNSSIPFSDLIDLISSVRIERIGKIIL